MSKTVNTTKGVIHIAADGHVEREDTAKAQGQMTDAQAAAQALAQEIAQSGAMGAGVTGPTDAKEQPVAQHVPVSQEDMARDEDAVSEAIAGEVMTGIMLPVIDRSDMTVNVTINGVAYRVPRGERVSVPLSVLEVLQNAGIC